MIVGAGWKMQWSCDFHSVRKSRKITAVLID